MGWRSDVLYVKGYTWVGGQIFCMSMDTHWLEIRCFCMSRDTHGLEVRCFVCEGIHMGWRSYVLYVKGYTWVRDQMFCM